MEAKEVQLLNIKLKSLTLFVLRLDNSIGSIEIGKDADFNVFKLADDEDYNALLHMEAPYSVYSKGRKITGKIYNYDGNFELEIKNGSGKIKKYYQNGKLKYEKEYLNGIIWNAKGYTQTGEIDYEIIDGKGILKEYFEDGKLVSEIDYYNGEKCGNGKEYDYYKDLTLIKFEGQYFYDMRWNGTFKEYNNGELISEIEYFKGELIPKSKNEDMDEYE